MQPEQEQPERFDDIRIPRRAHTPGIAVARRVALAIGLVLFVALVVRLTRDGYVDSAGGQISFLDAIYYASVTVTTTGYGDITAISSGARLATVLLITPARILFLILVVSTTVEVLTEQTRERLSARRWRNQVKDHYVICGFGSTGQAALRDLRSRNVDPDKIVVVDINPDVLEIARRNGVTAVLGNAAENAILEQAAVEHARAVIVTPGRDDTAVLAVLTIRELNPNVHLVAGGNEQENLHLLRQGGADEVIDSTAAIGRMLGLGTVHPRAAMVLEDLLDGGEGLEFIELSGLTEVPDDVIVVAIIRDGTRLPIGQADVNDVRKTDRLVALREQ